MKQVQLGSLRGKRRTTLARISKLHSITILLLAFIIGCHNAPKAGSKADIALQKWRSPASSLQQRADSVTTLIPKGASKKDVDRILGQRGVWTHFHGLSVDVVNNQQLPDHDYWRLVYSFPGGGVNLQFEPATSFGDRFVRAEPFQELMTVPLTNSP